MRHLRAVLDANVFVSALIRPDGPPGRILAMLIEDQAFELIASEGILAELLEAVRSRKARRWIPLPPAELEDAVVELCDMAILVPDGSVPPGACRDPDDEKYLAAAVAGPADCLVTGDGDLLVLREYQGVRIVTPRQFLELLEA